MKDCNKVLEVIESCKDSILEAERYIWKNAESGYREWKTHAYLKKSFEALGLTLHEFGNIPGFYVDFETNRPGPTLAVFGEMDALYIPTHPEATAEGYVHACGHNCQSAALYGLAIGLSAHGALDELCGRIRLIAVPAEELIEVEYRKQLKADGIIKFFGGKQELIYRGILDDVDLAFMFHQNAMGKYTNCPGSNGCVCKMSTFKGKASHAAVPFNGNNALYAANAAMTAANALRETFRDKDHIRFHPIITAGGSSVNTIPDEVVLESYVRGATMDAIVENNEKINRAFAASAAAMGCKLEIEDFIGYAPRYNDPNMSAVLDAAAGEILPQELIDCNRPFGSGCSDMGDVSTIMPACHPYIGGYTGNGHGVDMFVTDPYMATVTGAKIQYVAAVRFLENDAVLAKKAIEEYKPTYASKEEYLAAAERINFKGDAVFYNEDDTIKIVYKK